jgi:hypothetical protein
MKKLFVVLFSLALFAAGCGSSNNAPVIGTNTNGVYTGASSFSGVTGACAIPRLYECIDYSYSGVVANDPVTSLRAYTQSRCVGTMGGVFNPGGTCNRATAVGYCTLVATSNGVSTKGVTVYLSPMTQATAQSYCLQSGGTFSIQ